MPILKNARHERFAQELTRGRSQCGAYLAAGYKASSPSTAYAHGARLVRNGKVRARMNELQSAEEIKSLLTMQQHLEELRVLREMAKANCQMSAAIRAEELRGRLRGFYVDHVQHRDVNEFAQMSDEQLHDFIRREARVLGIDIGESVSRKLANQSNRQPSGRKHISKFQNGSAPVRRGHLELGPRDP